MRNTLGIMYLRRWIGKGGSINWPPAYPISHVRTFFWGDMRSLIYNYDLIDSVQVYAVWQSEAANTIQGILGVKSALLLAAEFFSNFYDGGRTYCLLSFCWIKYFSSYYLFPIIPSLSIFFLFNSIFRALVFYDLRSDYRLHGDLCFSGSVLWPTNVCTMSLGIPCIH